MTNRTDNFNRTDSALTINSPSDGGSNWTIPTATALWGIASNQAYTPVNVAQDIVVLESSIADVDVQVTTPVVENSLGLCARVTDDSNYLLFYFGTGGGSPDLARIYDRISGTFHLLATANITFANNDVMKFNLNGTALAGYQNGSSVVSTTSSAGQTVTKHGMRSDQQVGSIAGRFEDFSITALGGAGLFRRPLLNGLGAGGQFFSNPIG